MHKYGVYLHQIIYISEDITRDNFSC